MVRFVKVFNKKLTANAVWAVVDVDGAVRVEGAAVNVGVAGVPVAVGGVLAVAEAVIGSADPCNGPDGDPHARTRDVTELRGERI